MTQLVVFLIIGVALLLLSLLALLKAPPRYPANSGTLETLLRIVRVPGLDFKHPELLFDPADYRAVLSDPRLRSVARQLWRDRRRMGLFWLKMLQHDVLSIWRFRRLLTRYRVGVDPSAEGQIFVRALSLLALLVTLRISVALFGPFTFPHMVSATRQAAGNFSQFCSLILAHVPAHQLSSIEEQWKSQLIED